MKTLVTKIGRHHFHLPVVFLPFSSPGIFTIFRPFNLHYENRYHFPPPENTIFRLSHVNNDRLLWFWLIPINTIFRPYKYHFPPPARTIFRPWKSQFPPPIFLKRTLGEENGAYPHNLCLEKMPLFLKSADYLFLESEIFFIFGNCRFNLFWCVI